MKFIGRFYGSDLFTNEEDDETVERVTKALVKAVVGQSTTSTWLGLLDRHMFAIICGLVAIALVL